MQIEKSWDKFGYAAVAISAVVSAFGWFAIDRWLPAGGEASPVVGAILRTMFTLLPAVAGFLIASRRQRRTHKLLAARLDELRGSFSDFQRIRRIEHELHTMDRLAKVAREAVKNTASSAKELFGAIEAVDDPHVKERLVERYRYHTNNVVMVLSAVSEQMEESGKSIQRELTADDAIHILEREKVNSSLGVEHAREIMKARGIDEGLDQLAFAAQQATQLQLELSNLKRIAPSKRGE
jgi:hypothetical protein